MRILIASCREATLLAERANMGPLGARDRFRMWMHGRICSGCLTYARQSKVINELLVQRTAEVGDTTALEVRILQRIETGA